MHLVDYLRRTIRWKRSNNDLSGFSSDKKGVAAIEFGLLALPFFTIVFAIIETSFIFIGEITLEQAVARTARTVRVGSVAAANISEGDFKKTLCANISVLLQCDSVKFDLRSYSDFNSIPRKPPVANGVLDTGGFRFEPGNAGQIMSLRAFYEWPLFTDVIQRSMSNVGGGKYLMSASAVFQTEPF